VREGESCWKSGGDESVFILGEGPCLVGSDAMPDAAGGKGVPIPHRTRATRLDESEL
jgi:hypothetical protein